MTAPDAAYFVDERDNLPIFIHQQLDDYGLDPYEFRIYARIARRAGKGAAWESLKNMAVGCRMSLGKLKEALRCLIDRNLVTRESRPGSTSIYRLTPQRLWKTWDTYRPGSPDVHPPGSSDVYPPGSPGVHKVNPEEISPIEITPIPPQPPREFSGEKRMHKFRKNRVRKQERPDSKKQERPDSKKQERPDSKKQERPDSKKQERPDSNLIADVEVESVTRSQETSSLDSYQLSAAEIQEIQLSTGLPVYRHRRGPNGINPEFVEYIRQWMLSFAEREVPVSDALSYITKREPGGSLATEWLTVLTKAKEWYRSLEVEDSPTEGQLLASEVAIALNSPYSGTVRDRFEQVAGKYRWEIAPGEPIPELVQWYTTKIKFSKRPEMTGKPPGVLARIDLGDRFLAAAIYEEWEAWAKALLGNHERKVEILAPSPEVVPVVDVTPHPVKAADALLSQDPEERIVKLQEVYDTSGVHKAIVRGWLNKNPEWELEIFEHRVQRKNARACIF